MITKTYPPGNKLNLLLRCPPAPPGFNVDAGIAPPMTRKEKTNMELTSTLNPWGVKGGRGRNDEEFKFVAWLTAAIGTRRRVEYRKSIGLTVGSVLGAHVRVADVLALLVLTERRDLNPCLCCKCVVMDCPRWICCLRRVAARRARRLLPRDPGERTRWIWRHRRVAAAQQVRHSKMRRCAAGAIVTALEQIWLRSGLLARKIRHRNTTCI